MVLNLSVRGIRVSSDSLVGLGQTISPFEDPDLHLNISWENRMQAAVYSCCASKRN